MSQVTSVHTAGDEPSPLLEKPRWVVGVGAGAGGLEAIQLLFGAMAVDAGLAFVICRHVQSGLSDPLGDLLCTQTAMPVMPAEHGTVLEAGHIYLVAPNARMILLKDRLVHFEPHAADDAELAISAIDILLHSMAVSIGPAAMAVMLSGNDLDGLEGCQSVRGHGGLVLVQHPESTEFPQMPRRIIDADLASAVATPGGIADLIRRHAGKGRPAADVQRETGGHDDAFGRITALLASRFAIDAHAYRPSLVAKRVRRRLAKSKVATLAAYADLLAEDEEELAALHDDLLIRVTAFFRDPEAFSALQQEVMPGLVERMSADHPIRIWVPACATGEEAYSLAMLVLDRVEQAGKTPHVELIASDRHAFALEHARQGRYPRERLDDVPPALARRYLREAGEAFEVGPRLRRHVTFVEHDMLNAAPPDDIDLVSCRNLLIYLASASCEKAMLSCCKALKPGGFLFLGPSEQPGPDMTGLETVHGKWRVYRKTAPPPVDKTLAKLAAAHRRRPAEPILPRTARKASPAPKAPSIETASGLDRVLIENQRMLESTIDTLLSSNDTLRRRNRDLRAENQRLIHAHAALDDVATMIAHDLKAPIRTIERLADGLNATLCADEVDQDAMRWLEPMRHRLTALNRVIDDLLAYAREGPADTADLRPLDLGDLLRETLMLIGLPKGVRVLIRPPSLHVVTWPIPLACILRNLLGRSIERIGDGAGTIRIEATTAGRWLELVIADNGQQTADRAADLSFAIVRQFLEAAGGELVGADGQDGSAGRQDGSAEGRSDEHRVRFTWPIESSPKPESATTSPPQPESNACDQGMM